MGATDGLRRDGDLGWRVLRMGILTMIEIRQTATIGVASLVFLEGLPQRDSLILCFPGLRFEGPDAAYLAI